MYENIITCHSRNLQRSSPYGVSGNPKGWIPPTKALGDDTEYGSFPQASSGNPEWIPDNPEGGCFAEALGDDPNES